MLGKDAMKRKLLIWSAVLIVLGLMVLIPPVTRQWIFGPKIKGVPLCLWVDELRHMMGPEKYPKGSVAKILDFLGVAPPPLPLEEWRRAEMRPVFLKLLEDEDGELRFAALVSLIDSTRDDQVPDPALLAVLEAG